MAAQEQPQLWARLLAVMAEKGLEPHDLAAAMKWSSADQYFKWKNSDRRISRGMLARLARALRVPATSLDPAGEAWNERDRGPVVRSVKPRRLPQQDPAQGRDLVYQNDPLFSALQTAWPWLPEDVRRDIAQRAIASTPTTATEHPPHAPTLFPKAGG